MSFIITPPLSDFDSLTANNAAKRTYDANEERIKEEIEAIDALIKERSSKGNKNYVARINLNRVQQDILSEYYQKLGYSTEKVYTNTLYIRW